MTAAKLRDTLCSLVAIGIIGGLLHFAGNNFDAYTIQVLNLVAINAILAISLNLIYGFTGMFSLGHAGFMAIGAYVCTLCILSPDQKTSMWLLEEIQPWLADISLPFYLAVPAGGVVAALFGLLIALPVLRLGGDYLGIATLGFAEIIRVAITNAATVTNGALGIKGIPQYSTLGWNYGWLLITLYFILSLLRSNAGNVFKAIRDDEIAARTMGVNTFKHRVISFCVGAFFAGVGGALMAALISTIDPKMFNSMLTFNILMIVVAGGLGSVTGSIIGSVVITIMLEWLRVVEGSIPLGDIVGWLPFGAKLTEYFGDSIPGVPGMRMVIFSLLLMFIILFRRSGIFGMREFSWQSAFQIFSHKAALQPQAVGASATGAIGATGSASTTAAASAAAVEVMSRTVAPSAATVSDAPTASKKSHDIALELKGATMRFGGITAVNDLDMYIPRGEIVGLIGPNGAGKTTAFNMISGFYRPTSGAVLFNGKVMTGTPPHLVCKAGIARTFQNIRLFSSASALQNVMVGGHIRQIAPWWSAPFGLFRGEEAKLKERSMELLERLGLANQAHLPSGSLPYGAQRRLEIARALATNPSFLLLDEPAAGMNPQESIELMGLIESIRRDFNLTILLIEHDMKVVMGVCSHIWVLEYGMCIADGNADAIRNNPKVIEAYLGEEYLKYA